jgi:hypothetical protein
VSGPVDSISHVPLLDVLPSDHAAAADQLRRLAHELDAHPLAAGRIQWHWYPEHNTRPSTSAEGIYLLVFDTTITLFHQGADSLELTLDVAWGGELTVNAAVEVGCWCPSDHNIHRVREGRWPAAGTNQLVEGFTAGAAMLAGVLDSGPFDPRPWRLEAGLPDAPSERR